MDQLTERGDAHSKVKTVLLFWYIQQGIKSLENWWQSFLGSHLENHHQVMD